MPDGGRLLIIDDDRDFCADLATVFSAHLDTSVTYDGPSGLQDVERNGADVVLLDLDFGTGQSHGLEILERILELADPPQVIILSGSRDMQMVVRAIKLGAFHYVIKPADVSQLDNLIRQALRLRQGHYAVQALQEEVGRLTGNFIAGDDKTFALLRRIEKVAPTNTTVLITGESGTGKEMIARRIHDVSARRDKPMICLNCGAVPPELIESEIFGHAKGTFTGATSMRVGKMELAGDGDLFLDEIGESPVAFQVKLLRAIGEKVLVRLGENREIPVTARVLAATSENLEKAVGEGRFREALYYRLDRYRIEVPPLRERRGDIEPLALHFLGGFCRDFHRRIDGFSPVVMARFMSDPWPGNVRQLRNVIEAAVIDCEGSVITLADIRIKDRLSRRFGDGTKNYKEAAEKFQREFIRARLAETGGNVTRAAANCGMARQQFQKKMSKLGISSREFKS